MVSQKEFVGTEKQVKPRRGAPTFRQILDEIAVIESIRSGCETPLEIAEATGLSEKRIWKAAERLLGVVYYADIECSPNGEKLKKHEEVFALVARNYDK